MDRSRWQRFVVHVLPWYNVAEERERDQHTEDIRVDAIRARMKSEAVAARLGPETIREAYRAAGERVRR